MRQRSVAFAAVISLMPVLHCLSWPAHGADHYIVTFRPGAERAGGLERLRAAGIEVVAALEFINAAAVKFPAAGAAGALAKLRSVPGVAGAEPDPLVNWLAAEFPGVPAYDDGFPWPGPPSPDQFLPWGIERVNAPKAWAVVTGAGTGVCVIDSGIDADHPDLRANIAAATSTAEGTSDFTDGHGHGSHVAGTIAAADNAEGVVGAAPRARLYAARAIDREGYGRTANVLAAMEWCLRHGARVVNMSIATAIDSEALRAGVRALHVAGMTVVAAAGNSSGPVEFPAAYPEVIAVAAMDKAGAAAWFSNRGPEIDLIAPGEDIDSTYMKGLYSTLSGTSMAAPHVSGLAALAISKYGLKDSAAVRAVLENAAVKLEGVPADRQGAGLIDAGRL